VLSAVKIYGEWTSLSAVNLSSNQSTVNNCRCYLSLSSSVDIRKQVEAAMLNYAGEAPKAGDGYKP